jgi:hypothetical protein
MLIGVQDIGPMGVEEIGNRSHDPPAVWTVEQKNAGTQEMLASFQ